MTIQPPFLGRNLGKGTDVEAWSSFSVWHVIVFPVKLLPPACILVSHQLCVSWLCFIVSLCCTIMFNCVTWTCVCFGFSAFPDTKLWHNEGGYRFRSALCHGSLSAGESLFSVKSKLENNFCTTENRIPFLTLFSTNFESSFGVCTQIFRFNLQISLLAL